MPPQKLECFFPKKGSKTNRSRYKERFEMKKVINICTPTDIYLETFMQQLGKAAVNPDESFCCSLFFSKALDAYSSSKHHLCWAFTLCLVLSWNLRTGKSSAPLEPVAGIWLREKTCHNFVICPPTRVSIFYHSSQTKLGTTSLTSECWVHSSPSSFAGRHIMKWDVLSETQVRNLKCMASRKPHQICQRLLPLQHV